MNDHSSTAWKVSKYGVCSGPYFPAFGLNTERYWVSFRIQSEYGKYGPEKTPYWQLNLPLLTKIQKAFGDPPKTLEIIVQDGLL